jgi:hypothetical protein
MRAVLLCDFREGRTSFARSKQSSVSTGQQLLDELHKGTTTVVLLFNYNVKEIEKWHFWGVRDRFFLKKGV